MIPRFAHRTRMVAAAVAAVAVLGLTACTGGGGAVGNSDVSTLDESLTTSINDAVESAMAQSGSTQAVVGVWTANGELVRGYGDGVTGSTSFRGAQATQPVLCALVLDLVDQGKLTLDREVSKDLTRQSDIEGVTYAQLCDMHAGIADYKGNFVDIFANNPTRVWPDRELIAQGLASSPLSWPGLDLHQSDTNAVLLGRALAVKTGTDLPTLLNEHVFSAAGMGSTYFPEMTSTTVSGDTLAGLSYPASGGAPVCDVPPAEISEVSPSMLAGAGATVTTVSDLHGFYSAYLAGNFGGSAGDVVTQTTTVANPERDGEGVATSEPDEAGDRYGFNVEQVGPLFGRSGSITGTLTAAYQDPASGFSVVVTLNNSSAGTGFARTLAFKIAALATEAGNGPELAWTAAAQEEALAAAAICQ